MNTDELLLAIRPEFPELTDKTLRDWVKEGFLQPPVRVGMGSEGGTPNEWADDSIARIRVIKSVTNKRVDKTRARRALIANGYFIGVAGLRDEFDRVIEEIHEHTLQPKRFEENSKDEDDAPKISGVIKPKSSIFDDDLMKLIGTALVMPTSMFNEAIGRLREEATSGYPVQPTPLTELLSLCSIYQLEQTLNDVTDDVLIKCFYDAAVASNGITPILGWLCGYDEYPPIPDDSYLILFTNGRRGRLKLEPYEFECFVRLYLVAANIIIHKYAHKLIKLIPLVLTHASTRATLGVEVDKDGVNMITNEGVNIPFESVKSGMAKVLEEDHRDNIQFTQSLFK